MLGISLFQPAASAAPASPSPSTSGETVTIAGTSFLTAATIDLGQPVELSGSTGDYLYWAFEATAGQTPDVTATVTLPPAGSRHGAQTWTVEVFDGLRRRQACTAGAQAPTAPTTEASLTLGCTLRQVRAWAEPWSGDPLPGLYYVRLSAMDLPEEDLGLTIGMTLRVTAAEDDDPVPEGGALAAPLNPAQQAGRTVATTAPSASASATASDGDWLPDLPDASGWWPEASTRWVWTILGGLLAAIAGVVGFRITRHPRRRPAG
ncbi:MAG: peptidase [Micromonosporaceae bacterium]|nr:peptidase [Micromonosporaceae bacterium]